MTRQYWCGLAVPSAFNEQEFINAYKEAFGGPPYYETYSDEEVADEILRPHLRDGIVMYVADRGKLIGFGCALPFNKAPDDVREFLEGLHQADKLPAEFDHRNAWYMSELGVLNAYRGVGAAWELVRHRMYSMSRYGAKQFFMRTAWPNSLSMPMYIKCGAKPLAQIQDISSSTQVTENSSQSHMRVYLWGDTLASATKIGTIQDEKGYIPFASSEQSVFF